MNNNQAILDVLNSLEVIEQSGGDDAYILVENSIETRAKLNAVGVTDEQILGVGDEEQFCILALACNEGYGTDYRDGKLVKIEDEKFQIEDIDGCEFVNIPRLGKALVSRYWDDEGVPTGMIQAVYSDGSYSVVKPEEAQWSIDSGEWVVFRQSLEEVES